MANAANLTEGGPFNSVRAVRRFNGIAILLRHLMYIHNVVDVSLVGNHDSCVRLPIPQGQRCDPTMSKTKILNVRIEPELKKKAKKLAEADGRSLSNWVTKLISSRVKDAEKNGELDSPP
jgi:hypothetical protein